MLLLWRKCFAPKVFKETNGGSKPPPYILDVPYHDPSYKETMIGAGRTVCQRRLAAKFRFV